MKQLLRTIWTKNTKWYSHCSKMQIIDQHFWWNRMVTYMKIANLTCPISHSSVLKYRPPECTAILMFVCYRIPSNLVCWELDICFSPKGRKKQCCDSTKLIRTHGASHWVLLVNRHKEYIPPLWSCNIVIFLRQKHLNLLRLRHNCARKIEHWTRSTIHMNADMLLLFTCQLTQFTSWS